jgi:ABC-2 type transport system ATP-binding protein
MNATILQASHLTKRFGTLKAVDDLSLEVHEGEIFGFLGPNGAGKTTAISMLCGLLQPDTGEVFIRGEHPHTKSAFQKVGVCPQSIILWERLTCMEQLIFVGQMYGMKRGLAEKRSEFLLQELALSEKKNQLARNLSGGMQRRLNLLMALVHDPEIIILDEPEAGLDPQSRVLVRDFIRGLARKRTVILTTHNMDEADRVADRIAIIDNGRLLVLDTPEALKRTVGEGDVVDLAFRLDTDCAVAEEILRKQYPETQIQHQPLHISLRVRNAVSILSDVVVSLHSAGIYPEDIRLRENSLEDVFLQITGKRLRE